MSQLATLLQQKRISDEHDPLASYRPCHANAERFHRSTKKRRYIFGGNRSSKSTCSVVDMIQIALGRHPYIKIATPNSGRVVGVDMEHGIRNILFPLIKQWAPSGTIKHVYRNSRGVPNGILWYNHSFTELMSYEQDVLSFESKALDYVVFDEPPPKPIYTANMARLIDRGGYCWGAMTLIGTGDPNSPFNDNWTWIYDDLFEPWDELSAEEKIDSPVDIFVFDTYDNKHLRREDIKAFEDSLSEEEKAARIHGQFINLMGRIHSLFERRVPYVIVGKTIPLDWPIYEAIDVNPKRGHAYIMLTVAEDGQLIICDELLTKPQETIEDFARRIKELRDERHPIWTLIDHNAYVVESSSKTSLANELMRCGIDVSPAHKGQESVFAGINRINTLLKINDKTEEPGLVIMSHCNNTIYQLYNYTWGKNNKPKDIYKDFPDAVRYAVMANPTRTGQQITVINRPPQNYYNKHKQRSPYPGVPASSIGGGITPSYLR